MNPNLKPNELLEDIILQHLTAIRGTCLISMEGAHDSGAEGAFHAVLLLAEQAIKAAELLSTELGPLESNKS